MLKIVYAQSINDEQKQALLACSDDIELVDCVTNRGDMINCQDAEIFYGYISLKEYEILNNLKWIHLLNTGCEGLQKLSADNDGLIITCTRGHSSPQMSEHAIAGLFYLARDFPAHEQGNRQNCWKPEYKPTVLESSQALILGVGGIGKVIAKKLQALGMKVRGVNYSGKPIAECNDMYRLDEIKNHLSDVKHVINCLPNTEQTLKFVDQDFLNALSPGATVVNISRGSVIDEAALLQAIDAGQIHGAVLDVTFPEPPIENSPLYAHPRVLVTGHLSWRPGFDSGMGFDLFLANLKRYINGDSAGLESVVDRNKGY